MQKHEFIKQRVALYIRVSTDEQVEKFGVALQKEALLSLVKSKPDGMVLAGEKYIYVDEGVSGTVGLDERPAFSRLKEDILMSPESDRPFDIVAVYKIDRFARQLKILLEVIEFLEEHEVKFISANESIDTSTPFGKAMLGIIGVIAELERDTILKRTRDGLVQAFEQGVVLGNSAPYGYTKDDNKRYLVLEEEADVVKEIFRLFVEENRSIDNISHVLHAQKIFSPAASAILYKKRRGTVRKKNINSFWNPGSVRRILGDELYVGKIYGNKYQRGKLLDRKERKLSSTAAPMIIDPLTFDKAQYLLSRSKHQRHVAKEGHVYLLSGLLKCNCCYNPEKDASYERVGWHGQRKKIRGKILFYYQCGRKSKSKTSEICTALPLPADEIETYLVDYAKKLVANPVAVFEHQKKLKSGMKTVKHLTRKDEGLLKLILAVPNRKSRLLEQHEANVISTPLLKKQIAALDADLKRYEKERAEVQMQITQHNLSRGYIKALDSFSEKYSRALEKGLADRPTLYAFLHSLIEEVVISTRPVTAKDIVAGRRKENQQIPNRIHIKLKLPQDILSEIAPKNATDEENAPVVSGGGSGYKSIASGRYRTRTCDLRCVKALLYQLS